MSQPAILITGGAGFLGSHLSDRYLEKGYDVIAIDNLSTGSKRNIAHLAGHPGFKFIEHDITRPLPAAVTRAKLDIVANLASPASPPYYQAHALETLAAGSLGVTNLLALARDQEARFFQASTSEVYGDPEIHPQPEDYKGSVNCYGPRSMYDESKRFAEATIYAYREKYGVNTAVVRIFNTYGPRMDPSDGRVVSNFIVQALQGRPLTVYGDGTQTRSFCYVDDLIEGFVRLIESGEEGPINIGNPGEFTMLELAEKIQELVGSSTELVFGPLPGDDPLQRQPDITLAKKKLGWEPKVTLDKGLTHTITYFRELLAKTAGNPPSKARPSQKG